MLILQMRGLNISNIMLGDDGWIAIGSCVSNIGKLTIGRGDDQGVTIKGVRALFEGIRSSTQTVSKRKGKATKQKVAVIKISTIITTILLKKKKSDRFCRFYSGFARLCR